MTSNQHQKTVISQRLRLSDGEIHDLIRKEKKKWQVFRLQQVREQSRAEAERVRGNVQHRKKQFAAGLEKSLLEKFQEDKENCLQKLQEEYDNGMQAIGEAHREAESQPDANEVLKDRAESNLRKASRRGEVAIKEHREIQLREKDAKNRLLQKRQQTARKEKARAQHMANLPTPEAFKKQEPKIPEKPPMVRLHEFGTLTTSNYVPQNVVIEKELKSTQPTAHQAAQVEELARSAKQAEDERKSDEDRRKQEQRGRDALMRERLRQSYNELMEQMEKAQKEHQLSAYLSGANLSIYQTEEARVKAKEAAQRTMEKATQKLMSSIEDEDESQAVEISSDESGIAEFTDSSNVGTIHISQDPKIRNFQELMEQIRIRREKALRGVYNDLRNITEVEEDSRHAQDSEDKSSEKETDKGIDTGIGESHSGESELPVDQPKTDLDKEFVDSGIYSNGNDKNRLTYKIECSGQSKIKPSHVAKGCTTSEQASDAIHMAETIPANNDIHLAETIPADRYQIRSPADRYQIRSKSVENVFQPSSSESYQEETTLDDIDVRIHFSGDSSSLIDTHLFTDNIDDVSSGSTRELENEYSKENVGHYSNSSTGSTSYLSPPEYLPEPVDFSQQALNNLQRIRNMSEKNALLLEKISQKKSPSKPKCIIPCTYTDSLKGEGSGKRPLKKKVKFDLQKRQLIHQYSKKLLRQSNYDLMQISASTLEGSGITLSSPSVLMQLKQSEEEGSSPTLSSSKTTPEICTSSLTQESASYPDIDEYPSRLVSSFSNTNKLLERNGNMQARLGTGQVISSDLKTKPVHGIFPSNNLQSHQREPEISESFCSKTNSSTPETSDVTPTWDTGDSDSSHVFSQGEKLHQENLYQREMLVLQQLQRLQAYKYKLLKTRDELCKDDSPSISEKHSSSRTTHSSEHEEEPLSSSQIRDAPSKSDVDGGNFGRAERLSPIREVDSDVSRSYLNVNSSYSYQTPSRELESSDGVQQEKSVHDSFSDCQLYSSQRRLHSTVKSNPIILSRVDKDLVSSNSSNRFRNLPAEATLKSTLQPISSSSEDSDQRRFNTKQNLRHYEPSDASVVVPTREPFNVNDTRKSGTKAKLSDEVSFENNQRQDDGVCRHKTSSSESVDSIPDMAVILQRFGLPWAQSMLGRMEKVEEKSSTDSSTSVQ